MKYLLALTYCYCLSLMAQDGVLEINQLCVDSGCFTGDDPGFPVEITNPGSYRLTSNLTVNDSDTTAIEMSGTVNTTFDLNGFGLLGITTCEPTFDGTVCMDTSFGVGIDILSPERPVVIQNGSIQGFGRDGIRTIGTGIPINVNRMLITQNGSDGICAFTSGTFVNNRIQRNGGNGISSANFGGLLLTDNIISFNAGMGISSSNTSICGGNVFTGNVEGDEDCRDHISPSSCTNGICPL